MQIVTIVTRIWNWPKSTVAVRFPQLYDLWRDSNVICVTFISIASLVWCVTGVQHLKGFIVIIMTQASQKTANVFSYIYNLCGSNIWFVLFIYLHLLLRSAICPTHTRILCTRSRWLTNLSSKINLENNDQRTIIENVKRNWTINIKFKSMLMYL